MFVRYYGPLDHRSGYAVAGRELIASVEAAGGRVQSDDVDGFVGDTPPDVVVVHCLPLDIPKVIHAARIRELMPGVPVVAYTTWDGYRQLSPEVAGSMEHADAIWVPCRALAGAVRLSLSQRVVVSVVPHAFAENRWDDVQAPFGPAWQARLQQRDITGLKFLAVGAWNSRKNLEGVVRAFLRAFTDVHQRPLAVSLHIHSFGADPSEIACAVARAGITDLTTIPQITISTAWLSDEEMLRMYRDHDVYVSASRGESWDLCMFDALIARMHIIAPATGRCDYLEDTSATFCVVRPTPVTGDSKMLMLEKGTCIRTMMPHGLSIRDTWLDPDIIDLADTMRDAQARCLRALRVNYDPTKRYGRHAVGQIIRSAIQAVRLATKKD